MTTMTAPVIPVILSGGVGSRLWPLSRKQHPKPLIRLANKKSLLQEAYLRAASLQNIQEIVTVTNVQLFDSIMHDYQELQLGCMQHTCILEPFGRNTAAAIGLAGYYILEAYGPDAIMLVLPADHLIANHDHFLTLAHRAIELAKHKKLITFGIKPERAETGYGYIEADGNNVLRFVEKPCAEKARQYVKDGRYFWNSGMFCMSLQKILEEIEQHCPALAAGTKQCLAKACTSSSDTTAIKKINDEDFADLENISIDFAVFEKSSNIMMIPCHDLGWSDIGSWKEFGKLQPRDAHGNHITGTTVLENTSNCVIYTDHQLVACAGIQDIVVVSTGDSVLVTNREHTQEIGKLVKKIPDSKNELSNSYPTSYRPWGSYTILQEGDCFKVKRIEVNPGQTLSLQSHARRNEHWVIVEGTANVIVDDRCQNLTHNQSVYIPIGTKHRITNTGTDKLVFIEVQCGDYLGEDDIIRYDDDYGRV